jgi:hypothetical protein
MLATELGDLIRVLEAGWIGERSFDFFGAGEGGPQPVTQCQESEASAGR